MKMPGATRQIGGAYGESVLTIINSLIEVSVEFSVSTVCCFWTLALANRGINIGL
jgi:hypothetical protein